MSNIKEEVENLGDKVKAAAEAATDKVKDQDKDLKKEYQKERTKEYWYQMMVLNYSIRH